MDDPSSLWTTIPTFSPHPRYPRLPSSNRTRHPSSSTLPMVSKSNIRLNRLSSPHHSTRTPPPPVHLRPNTVPKWLNPTTPNPSPLIPHMCSPCTLPSPKPHHPNSHPHFSLVPSLIRPRSIRSLALSTSPPTHMHSCTNQTPDTARRRSRPRPSLRPRPAPHPRAAAMVTRAFQVTLPLAQAV